MIILLISCTTVVKTPNNLDYWKTKNYVNYSDKYIIQPNDILEIKFLKNSEFNVQIPVRPDGFISLQLISEVRAAGRTSEELTDFLVEKYSSELIDPKITIIIRSFSSQKVFVAGEVDSSRTVKLEGQMTVLQAIAEAGGFTDTAQKDEVIVVRRQTGKKPVAIPVNIQKVVDGTDTEQDILLYPYDVVFVPKSPIASLNLWMQQYIYNNLPVEFRVNYQIFD